MITRAHRPVLLTLALVVGTFLLLGHLKAPTWGSVGIAIVVGITGL